MRKFLYQIFLFSVIGLFIGEIIARVFVLSSDIPRRVIDADGIQKYIPNQTGNWKSGNHKWQINSMGWPGPLPKSKENLITIIGDSYIENFMNPDSCHQMAYLKSLIPDHNFMEASRSGVSFIEAMEISKQLDSLQPECQLIYLQDSDFRESITQIKKLDNITQINLDKNRVVQGKLKSVGLKLILYNWKFIYYLYNRNMVRLESQNDKKIQTFFKGLSDDRFQKFKELIFYASKNYDTSNKILIFRPDSSEELVGLVKKFGFRAYKLENDSHLPWSFDYDPHWNCYGHQEAAKQISMEIINHKI